MNDTHGDRPRALLVYESMFGCTESVARAVADGLHDGGFDVTTHVVSDPGDRPDLAEFQLLVVGAPTHAFSLSRPNTRQEAVLRGAPPERARTGVREWLVGLEPGVGASRPAVAFDTRVTKVRHLPKAASTRAAHLLSRSGFTVVSRPAPFFVKDLTGPLVEGELDRAHAWGRDVALRTLRAPDTATG